MRTQVFIQEVEEKELTAKKLKFGKDFSEVETLENIILFRCD